MELKDLYDYFSSHNIQLMKKGSGIHIKKANRGKFTEYCGGKVTDTCIRRAKASGNPKLVKRATFAQNARKWKHEDGGNLHSPKIRFSVLDSTGRINRKNGKLK